MLATLELKFKNNEKKKASKNVFKIFLNVYLGERERERGRLQGGGAERERERQNWKQAPGSEHRAPHGTQTHKL